jgi:hypothetical protein
MRMMASAPAPAPAVDLALDAGIRSIGHGNLLDDDSA